MAGTTEYSETIPRETFRWYSYDANGLIGFDYIPVSGSAQTYFYRFDGEGRITAVVDPAGDVVAQYAYDPWGVITAVTDADGKTGDGSVS